MGLFQECFDTQFQGFLLRRVSEARVLLGPCVTGLQVRAVCIKLGRRLNERNEAFFNILEDRLHAKGSP